VAPTRPRRQPQRTCVACRRAAEKRDLIRLVRTDAGVAIDTSGHARGRGAYLCEDAACWTRAAGGGVLQRALRIQGPLSPEARATLEAHAASLAGPPVHQEHTAASNQAMGEGTTR
jgi:predicted RNA-binding protein YlxR (DUF448 family)